jgi:hypothetical protein
VAIGADISKLDYPNHQVRFVRTKATRRRTQIFVVFVRTPVFSRTCAQAKTFVRTEKPPSTTGFA